MAVQEVTIIYKGFKLYSKKFLDVRDIKDDDVVSASIYSAFLRLIEYMPQTGKNGTFIKMQMERHFIHMLEEKFQVPGSTGDEVKLFIFFVEDRDMVDAVSRPLMERILSSFFQLYGILIKEIAKTEMNISGFDKEVEKILGNLTTKQYVRFFNLWDKPRLGY